MSISRRGLFAAALSLALAAPLAPVAPAQAADKVTVGALRFVSSGGVFLAIERGYFAGEGIEVELKFFEAAQPIAVAVVSGDVQFGVTGMTAGAYNLAAKGGLVVVAAQGAEKKGVVGNQLVVSNEAYAKGLTSADKLPGASAAISQVGSTFHYQFGQIAAAKGFELSKVSLKPLQSLPNMVAAVKSGQVDAAILPPHLAGPLAARGEAKVVVPLSDIADYQFGGLFTSPALIQSNRDLVQRFVRAYQKGLKDYDAALMRVGADGKRVADENATKAATEIGKFVYPSDAPADAARKVIDSAPYCEPTGKLDLANIEAQIAWYKSEKLADPGVDAKKFVDTSFAQ